MGVTPRTQGGTHAPPRSAFVSFLFFFVLSSSLSGRQDEGVEMGTESNVISIVRIRGEINI